ncbi:sensor domain-containing protein [Halobacterium wangiae]|uniref:sensor domain-containing protein n=1 Tax=Halobacterium wangiae TaxID=2902623 RepID=UPI001E616FF5|nr:sensor domain-containing protein [Halobacterium wangiae]
MALPGDVPRSTAYLLLSFPLGIAYFTFVVAALSAGAALLVFVVGVFVLAGAAPLARRVAVADAALGAKLFGTPVARLDGPDSDGGMLALALAELTHPSGYRAVFYLLARFVVGVAGFTVVVTWLTLSGTLLGTPFYYDHPDVTVGVTGVGEVETLGVALLFAAAGVVVAVVGAVVVGGIGRTAARTTAFVLEFPSAE